MAKKAAFDWVNDTRTPMEDLAPLNVWDELSSKTKEVIENADQMAIPAFCPLASTIYAIMENNVFEARKMEVLIARNNRLDRLITMWETSNVFDFWLLKYPAWRINEYFERKNEKQNVQLHN